MDTVRKIIRCVAFVILLAALCCAITIFVVTDPDVPVKGFDKFDSSPLDKISEKYDVYDKNDDFLCSVNKSGFLKTDFGSIKQETVDAFLSIEDSRFYEHGAIDMQRIGKAVVNDIISMSAKEGASTITQQLVKNTYLTPEKTFIRKIKEIRIARAIENRLSKNEILELYFNSLYFGNNIYGIETAAQRFFGKSASRLELDESAMLAALINNPNKYDPYKNKVKSESRKILVLKRMRKLGHITSDEYETAVQETDLSDEYINNNIFLNYAISRAKSKSVKTAYDPAIQTIIQTEMTGKVPSEGYVTAVMVMDVKTEKIVAAASNSFSNLAGVKRQPGSTIKPLLCYAPALESGLITPVTPLLDEPTDFGGYKPSNYRDKYYGWVTASESLAKSLNVPAVKLLGMNGIPQSKSFAKKLGMEFSENDNGLALALGGMEYGVDLSTLCKAYSKIAAGGKRVMTKETAYLLTGMLGECARNGTAKALSGIPNVAAKTGTVGNSSGNSDAYCIAYNGKYVVGVWSGNPEGKLPEGVTGGTLPAELCAGIMKRPEMKSGAFEKPKTIVSVDIDANELNKYHRIIPAKSTTLPKDRLAAEFSIYNMPDRKNEEDLFFGDYENFKIVDGFVD